MNKNTFYKHHASRLITLLSAPTTGISRKSDLRHLTPEQIKEKVEIDSFWDDRRREREEFE